MADPGLSRTIQHTQDMLGKLIKKPPLTEKNLSRPPFRFLHDITTSVINTTGYLNGVFTAEELDSGNVTTREAKTEFMKKLVSAINETLGEEVPVKVPKVLAGQEPEKTNLMLQCLAQAILKSSDGSNKPSKPAASSSSRSKSVPKVNENKPTVKPSADKKPENRSTRSKSDGKPTARRLSTDATPTLAGPSGSVAGNKKPAGSKTLDKADNNGAGSRRSSFDKNASTAKSHENATKARKLGADTAGHPNKNGSVKEHQTLRRQNSSLYKNVEAPVASNGQEGVGTDAIGDDSADLLLHDNDNNDMAISSEIGAGDVDADATNIDNGLSGQRLDREEVAETKYNDVPSTFSTSSSTAPRLGTSRPVSARPAPPRPKTSMIRETEEPNYRPTTGRVANVLLDNVDAMDEDDTFMVRETTAGHTQGLGDVDETPELALTTGSKFDTEGALADLGAEDRGLLVNQILETQRELENKEKGDMPDVGAGTSREASKAEIEKLKSLLQECAKNANPLGKLLDFVREDIDTMQREFGKWREESKALDLELENAKRDAEISLQPLQHQLAEIETQIADKKDAITATKMSILRLQERIEKILSGLDRVKSSHGKLSIPSATQLMQGEPLSSRIRIDMDMDSPVMNDNDSFVPNNLMSQSNTGIRPSPTPSLFAVSTNDLDDPDNFDPFKV